MKSGCPSLSAAAAAALLAAACAAAAGEQDPADRHFSDRVQPLLESRCLSCHGPDQQKGGLRLDSREATLKGGDSGPAITAGEPARSLLIQAIARTHPDLEMPPKDPLTARDIAAFDQWIREGAPWPAIPRPAVPATPSGSDVAPADRLGDAWSDPRNPIVRLFGGQRLELWSLSPLRRVLVPGMAAGSTRTHPVDRFIDQRLAEAGLQPSPEANRQELARRLHFDLTGLPPSPEVLAEFLSDGRPNAYERLVDRLLDSPRYGEHQARLWLDVVRYSDSNGFDWDEFRPAAWRYRDYVIRSFNTDKPFDQFIREQLAGDELLEGPPRRPEEQDRLIATGFLRIGPQDNSASLFNEQARARAEWLADLTETTGAAFLGLTLSCCRCHDHKYDPLSQADHFRLRAFFEPIRYGDDLSLDLAVEQEEIRRQHAEIDLAARPPLAERDALLSAVKQRIREQRLAALTDEERHGYALASDPQGGKTNEQAAAIAKRLEPTDDDVQKAASADEKKRWEDLNAKIASLEKSRLPFTRGLLATDAAGPPPATHIHFQGDPRAPREVVLPGYPSILDPNPAAIEPPSHGRTSGRRLHLARWISSPANPLTARVLVNRAWQSFFGRGLVATPNDFGLAGARPTHPELLDWLAGEFMAHGWSVKQLHRRLVTSATYRQSSRMNEAAARLDANNTLYWRQNPRRLSAEQLRDSILVVAGLLQFPSGGPPVWPELPAEILQANPAFLDDNAEKTKGWYPSPREQQSVRSIYLVQKRTVRLPWLETFDQPENSVSCPQRTVSVVAPQALSLLNGELTLDAAAALDRRLHAEAGSDSQARVRRAFQLTLQRPPTPDESAVASAFLHRRGSLEFCRALLNVSEFAFVD